MRVLFVLEDLLVGGAQRHTLDLAAALNGRFGCAVLALADRAPTPLEGEAGVDVAHLDLRPLHPQSWRRVAEAIDARRPDLVVTVNPVATLTVHAARFAGARRTPRVAIFHATRLGDWRRRLRAAAFVPVARLCEALVYVSEAQHDLWTRRGLQAKRTTVIRNGVRLDQYSGVTPEDRAAARARLGWAANDLVFGLAATLRREKNAVQLVDALAALRTQGVPARLLIIGDGPDRPIVEARANEAEVADALHVTGLQTDVRPWLAALGVGVLTSTAVETLSLFALEAMASGVPMVMSDIGGAREIVTEGENGRLFPAGDTNALVAALAPLTDAGERARLGAAARATVSARFDYERMVEAYGDLFEQVVRGG